MEEHVDGLVKAFSADFYIDEDATRSAVRSRRIFNLMHLTSGVKVDLIVRKDSEYRHVEFARRKSVDLAGVSTWITSREDLILSKRKMNDTSPEMERIVTERYRRMTPDQRIRIAPRRPCRRSRSGPQAVRVQRSNKPSLTRRR